MKLFDIQFEGHEGNRWTWRGSRSKPSLELVAELEAQGGGAVRWWIVTEYESKEESMVAKKKKKPSPPASKPKKESADKAKAAKGNLSRGVERKRYTKELPVKIGEKKWEDLSNELATVIEERDKLEGERRARMAEFKGELVGLKQRETKLAQSVREHTELKPVACIEYLSKDKSTIIVVRIDDDSEVERRPAKGEQDELPFDKGQRDDDKDDDPDEEEEEPEEDDPRDPDRAHDDPPGTAVDKPGAILDEAAEE